MSMVPAVPREAPLFGRGKIGALHGPLERRVPTALGAPPQVEGRADPPLEEERVSMGRLLVGVAGFAVLALFNVAWIRDAPSGELTLLVSAVVHGIGLGLAAAGLTGLRTPTAALAGAVTGVAGLVVLCMPLLGIFGVQSLTATQLSFVVKNAILTLTCVTSAAVGIASAARLGPIRIVVAALWSIAALPAARFLYASILSLLRDPLNPADDALWSQLSFGFGAAAAAMTAVALIVARSKADSDARAALET